MCITLSVYQKFTVITTGTKGHLCAMRLGIRFVAQAIYSLALKINKKLTFCLLYISIVENYSIYATA